MVETRSGKMQDPAQERIQAEDQENGLQAHMNLTENPQVSAEILAKDSEMAESHKDANSEPAANIQILAAIGQIARNWTTSFPMAKIESSPQWEAPRIPPKSSRPRATPRPSRVHDCQITRQKQAPFRARSAAGQADQCFYLEFCPDFT
ncbi:hypothetical protein LAZ67_20001765 [Cordylochernes scorpioides]|uniref:Uncharacterized protein n=1 Tax=Cordylochernes scorpioides TaxID=51811 RepID=A0ABY6LMM9_9ARAC|nr:hypothetical protein LAZ67_20001765 [Cordylochernes scorpioides]